ncbi:adhesion G protein-coupled receptor F5-like [Discoglossus pictus]
MEVTAISNEICKNPPGVLGSRINTTCDPNQTGYRIKECTKNDWQVNDALTNCVSAALNKLSIQTGDLTAPGSETQVPNILSNLNTTLNAEKKEVTSSPKNIELVVNMLSSIQNVAKAVDEPVMKNFLDSVSIVVDDTAKNTWTQVPDRTGKSSELLQSVEKFAEKLNIENGSISIRSTNVILSGITKTDSTSDYDKNFTFTQSDLTGTVQIDKEHLANIAANARIVSIAYATMKDVLPINTNTSKPGTINGLVMTTIVSNFSNNNFLISMKFKKSNTNLTKGDCVFWNFIISDWDNTGCTAVFTGDYVDCQCNHLTSFSILMSSGGIDDKVLDLITYIGVGISIFSLVVCIIVEATVWKSVTKNKTSYMRHICLVNIALSLLVADIWFIVGAFVRPKPSEVNPDVYDKPSDACVTATFFSHLFYLSVFFWMLTMGLILFYRLVYVLHDMSKTTMMAISFVMGYVCPLIIAVITVAVTMSQSTKPYTASKFCWLNFEESMAFIAFIAPALTILLINFIILIVVIVKLLRPTIGDRPKKDEKNTLVHIAKSIAILTPLLGLTWAFGIGTVAKDSPTWLHGIFAALNSLQGLFILLFGCLLDKKVRDSLLNTPLSRWASQQTKTTNASSSSEPPFSKTVFNLFGKKGAYNISSAQMSSSSDPASNSYSLLN